MPGAKGAAIQSCLAGAGRRCFETAVRGVLKSSLDVSILCHAFGRKTDSTFGLKLRTEAVSTHLESVYSIPEGGRCQEEEVEHTAYQPVRKSHGHLSSASWVNYTRCLVVDDGEEVEGRQAGRRNIADFLRNRWFCFSLFSSGLWQVAFGLRTGSVM